ncbi:MAG: hypothetical protein WKF43_04240 [Acidimicrobiales bacterium]
MTRAERSLARVGVQDQGATLLLVLVFLTVFGVLIGAVLGAVDANLKTTSVVRNRAALTYAADAAIEEAVKRVAIDPTLCPDDGTNSRLPDQTLNARLVRTSCDVRPDGGAALGASGWAAILTGDLDKQNGGEARFAGPISVAGTISASGGPIVNEGGSVVQHDPKCEGELSAPAPGVLRVEPTPPYTWQCTTAPAPDPPHDLPPKPDLPKGPLASDGCAVFFPGTYTDPPALSAENYFVSGVYYFESIGPWLIGDATIVAGSNPSDTTDLGNLPCRVGADAELGGGGSGFGVEWIFGGDSSISVGENSEIEIFSRVPGPGPKERGMTPRLSLVALPSPVGDYLAADPPGGMLLDTAAAHPALALHGLVYAPSVDLRINEPNGAVTFQNGLVARSLLVNLTGAPSGDPVTAVDISPTNSRWAQLTATATSPDDPDVKPLVSRAMVEIRNTTNPATVVVHSWRTG